MSTTIQTKLRRLHLAIVIAGSLLGFAAKVQAQARPTATGCALWVGAEYSSFNPSFGPPDRLSGIGAYATLRCRPRLGLEGQVRLLHLNGFYGEAQDNYLAGPTLRLIEVGRLTLYSKLLAGAARMRYPFKIGEGSYWAVAPGSGIELRLSGRLAVRADYEYQLWPNAPGIPGEPSGGLSPNGFSLGIAYKPLDGLGHRHSSR